MITRQFPTNTFAAARHDSDGTVAAKDRDVSVSVTPKRGDVYRVLVRKNLIVQSDSVVSAEDIRTAALVWEDPKHAGSYAQRVYSLAAQLLDRVEKGRLQWAHQERARRVRQCDGHRVAWRSEPMPFCGTVNPHREEPRAHGGVRYLERCRCGAERLVLRNGEHVESERWGLPGDPR